MTEYVYSNIEAEKMRLVDNPSYRAKMLDKVKKLKIELDKFDAKKDKDRDPKYTMLLHNYNHLLITLEENYIRRYGGLSYIDDILTEFDF